MMHVSLCTEYVAAVYAEMRQEEAQAQVPHSYTTARTLLSILRLSQALARLRFSQFVAQASTNPLPLTSLSQGKTSTDVCLLGSHPCCSSPS